MIECDWCEAETPVAQIEQIRENATNDFGHTLTYLCPECFEKWKAQRGSK